MRRFTPQWNFNPFVNTAVGSPWSSREPDVPSINSRAYQEIFALLRQIDKTPQSAALVLGEAGTGKTHLIKRLVSSSDADMIFVYVHPFKDHRTMFRSLMEQIVQDLEIRPRTRGDLSGHTQLECIVAHVIARAFADYVHRYPDEGGRPFLAKMKSKPLKVLSFRQYAKWTDLLQRTEDFLRERDHLRSPMSLKVVKILFQYLDKSKREAVRSFLAGFVPGEDECRLLSIAPAEGDTAVEAIEERSKEILKTIGALLGYYRPMILCFDQLENLNTPALGKSFGVLVTDLVNEVDNVLPVAFIRPDSWEDQLKRYMDRASSDRIGSNTIVLQGPDLDQALDLVRARLEWAYDGVTAPRPHDFYPFRKEILEDRLTGLTSPRSVILQANRMLGEAVQPEDPVRIVSEHYQAERERLLSGEEEMGPRKDVIVAALQLSFQTRRRLGPWAIVRVESAQRPDLILELRPAQGGRERRSVAIVVENEIHWRPVQASLKNLTEGLEQKKFAAAFFLRDSQLKIPPKRGRMPATVQVREAFEQAGGRVIYLEPPHVADLHAIVYTLDKIGSGDLSYISDKSGSIKEIQREAMEKFLREEFPSDFFSSLHRELAGHGQEQDSRGQGGSVEIVG
jgi:hypothetical protein